MRKKRQTAVIRREQKRFLRRMGDMSEFMKTLKQRFSIWYRHHHESFTGTLWEGRFKSVVVQGVPASLSAVSAYIDLNPVRARMVDDPAKYKWSGYGAAMAGDASAMQGIARVFRPEAAGSEFVAIVENHYKEILYVSGRDAMGDDKVREVIAARGKLPMKQFLRLLYCLAFEQQPQLLLETVGSVQPFVRGGNHFQLDSLKRRQMFRGLTQSEGCWRTTEIDPLN